MQFHYPKVKCTYNTNVNNDYYSADFVAVEGGGANGKRPPSAILEGTKVSGGAIVPYHPGG